MLYNGHLDHVPPGDMDTTIAVSSSTQSTGASQVSPSLSPGAHSDMKCNVVAAAFGQATVKRWGYPCAQGRCPQHSTSARRSISRRHSARPG